MGEPAAVKLVKRGVAWAVQWLGLLPAVMDAYLYARYRRVGGTKGEPTGNDDSLPPARLRFSASGTSNIGWFLESGRSGHRVLRETISEHLEGRVPRTVLDFGCGCGRVLRHFRDSEGSRFFGVDWNPAAVRWCRRKLRFAECYRCSIEPPLSLPVDRFDLIYAFSVFTHMTCRLQKAWGSHLAERLERGGLLVISTHGDAFRKDLSESERCRYDSAEIVIREPSLAGTNLCAAYHPASSVRELFPPWLEVVSHVAQGARGNPPQDLWVLRRTAA
jgi:SAM-dependent methyltransferase